MTTDAHISFGLRGIRGIGDTFVEEMIKERQIGGPFKDVYNFILRLPNLNLKQFQILIRAGAFDSFGYPRLGLLYVSDSIFNQVTTRRKQKDEGTWHPYLIGHVDA